MAAYFTRDEIRDIKMEVTNSDFYAVAAYYGIPIKKRSILCPFHNDRHYGSAMIGENRNSAYCFVCNRSITVFDLIMHEDQVDFQEAVLTYWCKIMGHPEPEKKVLRKWKPGRKDLAFLGLSGTRNQPRVMPVGMVSRMERNNLPKGWDYDRESFDEEADAFACGPITRKIPLDSLEEDVYWDILKGKAKENIEAREKRCRDVKNTLTRLGHIYYMYPEIGRELSAKFAEQLAYAKRLAQKIERASK